MASPPPTSAAVVHRDLKSDNVFITEEERVKILDFGIARLSGESDDPISDQTATRTALTRPGVVVGTAAYMSQALIRGAVVDARSDLLAVTADQFRDFMGDLRGCVIGRALSNKFGWKIGDRIFLQSFVSGLRRYALPRLPPTGSQTSVKLPCIAGVPGP